MKTVAFLQNMWVRDPDHARGSLATYGDRWWRRATYQFLFGGCLSGRRLKSAFGDLCQTIIWEESTREIAGDPRTILAPQPAHIRAVIDTEQPAIVLAFGRIASGAVGPIWAGPLIRCPHPAARQADTPARLQAAAGELREFMRTYR